MLSRLPISERPRSAREGTEDAARAWGGSRGSGGTTAGDVFLGPARCVAMARARERRKGDLTHLAVCALAVRARCQNVAGDVGGKEGRTTVK